VCDYDDGSCTCKSGFWESKCYFACGTGCKSSMWKVKVIDLVTACSVFMLLRFTGICVFVK